MRALGRISILIVALVSLSACGPLEQEEEVFPKDSLTCSPSRIEGEFIVRWRSGKVSLEKGSSREEFLKKFVRPKISDLVHVEYNRRIQLAPTQVIRAQSIDSNVNNWGQRSVKVDAVWSRGIRGLGVTVAVIDSGLDISHPQIVNQIAHNPGESGSDKDGSNKASNGIDDDGNGLIDDDQGYDFAAEKSVSIDYLGHGTHVSGVIGAEHSDNSTAGDRNYVQGIAPGARILPIAFIDSSQGGTLFNAIRSLEYAASRGAQVINASWGGAGCSPELEAAVKSLSDQGVIFVSASGNSGLNVDLNPEFPAAYNFGHQITVGDIGPTGLMSDHSNYGVKSVHIFAPGVDIESLIPGGMTAAMTGTSMATPFVTGAVALLLSHRPKATVGQIREALYRSASKDRFYQNASRGALDLSTAIAEIERLAP